mmetsp:Transcript_25028/g.47052  ORF Transcript_25028/g.47052 Transcript_25028/m.47052 type:complete len:535 (-) Transcript_25028:546-2150(-)
MLLSSVRYDLAQGHREASFVVVVEVRRRLVEGEDAAGDAEGLGEGEADDDGGEDALPGGAPAAHVHLGGALAHDHPIVVAAGGLSSVGDDADVRDVRALVSERPEFLDDFVDVLDLDGVVAEQGAIDGVVVLFKVLDGNLGRLELDHGLAVVISDALVLRQIQLLLQLPRLLHHRLLLSLEPVLLIRQFADLLSALVELFLGGVIALDLLDLLCHVLRVLLEGGDLLEGVAVGDVVPDALPLAFLVPGLGLEGEDLRLHLLDARVEVGDLTLDFFDGGVELVEPLLTAPGFIGLDLLLQLEKLHELVGESSGQLLGSLSLLLVLLPKSPLLRLDRRDLLPDRRLPRPQLGVQLVAPLYALPHLRPRLLEAAVFGVRILLFGGELLGGAGTLGGHLEALLDAGHFLVEVLDGFHEVLLLPTGLLDLFLDFPKGLALRLGGVLFEPFLFRLGVRAEGGEAGAVVEEAGDGGGDLVDVGQGLRGERHGLRGDVLFSPDNLQRLGILRDVPLQRDERLLRPLELRPFRQPPLNFLRPV